MDLLNRTREVGDYYSEADGPLDILWPLLLEEVYAFDPIPEVLSSRAAE